MIRAINICLNAAHPEIPLLEATTFVGSPSAVFVSGVPATVGLWRITAVKVVAHYPDDSATTALCVKGAAGVWTATLPATATSGRVTHGFEVLADGIDEHGDAVTGYVLGFADFAVFTRDMTIDSGGTLYYMHYFDAVPQTPKKGDVAPDGSGGLQLYDGTSWVSMGGGYTPPPGGIPKTDLSEGVQASLDKADTAFQKPAGGIPKTDLASGVQASLDEVSGIEDKIPAQASAQNQLADKSFVNSSIATNTATFRGTYNLVADFSLTTSATQEQVAAAIAAKLAALSITPENNDYCFVQVPRETSDPTVIDRIDRYKCTVTESGGTTTRTWGYEWSLNNSSFTADQWAAINSGITSGLVAKLGALPTADELAASLLAKYEKPSGGIPKTDLSEGVQASLDKADTALQNSGDQLLDGSINASNFLAAGQLIVGTSSNGLIFSQDDSFVYATVKVGGSTISTYKFPKDSDWAGDNGNIARLLDIYAAVQQIAPAWVNGTAYTVNALVSYNGVVYRCKTDTVSPHTAKPNTDTTHWEAKKVSELFLPLTDVVVPSATATAGQAASAYATHLLVELTHNVFHAAIGIFEFSRPMLIKVGSHVIYGTSNTNKAVYRCTTENAAGEDWDENDFTKLFDLVPLAPLASPTFTGTPTAPTPTTGDDSTKVATTAFVQATVAGATPNLDYVMRVNPETGEIYYTTPDANTNA